MSGDEKHFCELLKRNRSMIRSMCWRFCGGDVERLKDLMQEVAIALWTYYANLRQGDNPKLERAWVWWHTRTLLHNSRRRKRMEQMPEAVDIVDDEQATATDRHETIAHLLSSLASHERRLVEMHLSGYTGREISQQTGMSENAVRKALSRAIDKMKSNSKTERI